MIFETVAQLKLATLTAGQLVSTKGYYVAGDGGGASYLIQPSSYVALAGDATLANGNVAELQINGNSYLEKFGATGNGDEQAVIQAAIDRMADSGGGTLYALGYYTIQSTLTLGLSGDSVTLKGVFSKNVFSASVSTSDGGVIYADFTSGPAILIADGGNAVEGLIVKGSPTRRAAAITTGARLSNCGILVEGEDTSSDIIQSVSIKDTRCVSHPADGLGIEGDITNIVVDNFYSNDVGRHGLSVSSGDTGGRTNKELSGIIMIRGGKSFDCGGHGLAIGNPASTKFPYRITVINREGYRLALDAAQRYSTAANWIVCQDGTFINCAWGGTTTGNVSDHEGLEIGGRDITLSENRYINCQNNYVVVRQQSGFSTKNIKFDGGIASTVGLTPPADFATIAPGADGVHFVRIDHDGANAITTIPVDTYNNDIMLHDITANKTVHHNHEIDYSNATVSGLTVARDISIASNVLTVDRQGYYQVDTESFAATGLVTTISGAVAGTVIVLRQENSSRVVTLQHGGGSNIRLSGAANFAFTNTQTFIQLMYDGVNWYQIAPSVSTV